jgi:hypothetical protein
VLPPECRDDNSCRTRHVLAPGRLSAQRKGDMLLVSLVATLGPKLLLSPLITLYLSPYQSRPFAGRVQLVEGVLVGGFIEALPGRLIGDKARDSSSLDEDCSTASGIEIIASNRRRRSKTWGGRKLCRCKRRSKAQGLFAWSHASVASLSSGSGTSKTSSTWSHRLPRTQVQEFMRLLLVKSRMPQYYRTICRDIPSGRGLYCKGEHMT